MSKFNESVSTINSTLRTILTFAIVGMVGWACWFGYTTYQAPRIALEKKQQELESTLANLDASLKREKSKDKEINTLNTEVATQKKEIVRLDTSVRLLKVDHRLAEIRVIRLEEDEDKTKPPIATISFVEVNDEGAPIGEPRLITLEGDMVYVECLVAKFEDRYIEQSALDRSTSICIFQRMFGEFQEPSEGFELDKIGARPNAYHQDGEISEFEKKIWDDFWNIANDPKKARQLGIRAAHSETPGIKIREGKTYRLMLRSSGGLSITPLESDKKAASPNGGA